MNAPLVHHPQPFRVLASRDWRAGNRSVADVLESASDCQPMPQTVAPSRSEVPRQAEVSSTVQLTWTSGRRLQDHSSSRQGGESVASVELVRFMVERELETLATVRTTADGLRLRILMRMADRASVGG